MITFAKSHKRALGIEFLVVVLLAMAMPGLIGSGEFPGWLMLFGALPWSLASTAAPGVLALVIVSVGLGINAVLATIVIWYSVSWWLKTLRYNNDG